MTNNNSQEAESGTSTPQSIDQTPPITDQTAISQQHARELTGIKLFSLPKELRFEIFANFKKIFNEDWTKYLETNANYQPCAGLDDLTNFYNQVSQSDEDKGAGLLCTLDEFRKLDRNLQIELDVVRFPVKKQYLLWSGEESEAFLRWIAEQPLRNVLRVRDVKIWSTIQFVRSVEDVTDVQDWMLPVIQQQQDFLFGLSCAPGLERVVVDFEICCVKVGQAKQALLDSIKVEMERAFGRPLGGGLTIRVMNSHLLATTFSGW